jgi:ribonuclease III
VTHALEPRLGHVFSNTRLLTEALTHRSYGTPHNERLEFIGDGVLNCVMALTLYARYPQHTEGQLSRLRANLVSRDPLARIAAQLDLGAELKLGEGEWRSGGRERPSILADAVEALFGAVMQDAGFEATRAVVLRLFAGELAALNPNVSGKDAKTELQEWLQGRKLPLPDYSVEAINGAQHSQTFAVRCVIAARGVNVLGEGLSRRAAEQSAAQAALDLLVATK